MRKPKHPLISYLSGSEGNAKTLLFLEPLWGIPFNLIAPFATLYMYTQGVTDVQIGLILSISMVVQVFVSFCGGIITDKLGRKRTTMLGDMIGWSVACAVWAMSGSFWMFLVAVLFNSFEQVNQTAWHCLLIEDAPKKDMLNIYTWVTIGGLVAVFFAPISGVLIDRFSLVPVIRILYWWFSINMLIKTIVTYRHTKETRQGMIRLEQTAAVPVWQLVREYTSIIPRVFKNKATMRIFTVIVLLYITNMINSSFFSLYVSTRLGVADRYLAFFPILRAIVMLVFMFFIQQRLEHVRIRIPLQAGLVVYVACQVLLLLIPQGSLLPVVAFILLEAVANALVMPRKDAMLAMNIEPEERARIMAVMVSFTIAFSSPFGYLVGLMSSIDRRLPFVLSIVLFTAAIAVVGRLRDRKEVAAQ